MTSARSGKHGFVVVAGLAVSLAGCFGPVAVKYEMLPVEGTVTMDGQPLAGAEVMLDSLDGPRGFGVTDGSGKFTITTRQFGAGLPAGDYRVFIGGSEKTRLGPAGVAAAIPLKYRETGMSKVTIGPGSGPLALELTSRPGNAKAEADDASER